ncbi:hypothetical protein COHA_008300, partial [Chlorella ohadii]
DEGEEKWVPTTKLGRLVQQGKIKSLEQIYLFSLAVKEYQIVDFFLGGSLKDEVMKIMPVQKQTRAGQRTRFKAFVVVGDYNGHCGLGVKCAKEVATAIRGAIILAKMATVPVRRGYWGNKIGKVHTVPTKVTGECGSVTVRLIPAPRGAGIVAARTPKKVLQMAGIEDCYTCSRGSTRTLGNFVKATFYALANTYGFLTPDLWRETVFTKSPLQEYSDFLAKPVVPGVAAQGAEEALDFVLSNPARRSEFVDYLGHKERAHMKNASDIRAFRSQLENEIRKLRDAPAERQPAGHQQHQQQQQQQQEMQGGRGGGDIAAPITAAPVGNANSNSEFMARLMREPAAPAGIPKYHGGPAARQAAGPAAAAPAAAAPVGKPSSKEEAKECMARLYARSNLLPTVTGSGKKGAAAMRSTKVATVMVNGRAKEWEEAQLDINRLFQLNGNFGDVAALLKQLAQLRALLEARKAEGHKKVFICAPLLSCIGHLDDDLDAQWAAEGLLDASGTELELPAGYSPLCFPLVIRGLGPLALEPVQPGSKRAVATGADGQAYALTAVGKRLWGQMVRAMFGSPQAAARVPLYWSTQEPAGLEAGDGWLQQAQLWE